MTGTASAKTKIESFGGSKRWLGKSTARSPERRLSEGDAISVLRSAGEHFEDEHVHGTGQKVRLVGRHGIYIVYL
jgi:hypothetical protein